jgi:hypothetical protein
VPTELKKNSRWFALQLAQPFNFFLKPGPPYGRRRRLRPLLPSPSFQPESSPGKDILEHCRFFGWVVVGGGTLTQSYVLELKRQHCKNLQRHG